MGEGAVVFAKLTTAQGRDILNAPHVGTAHISAELLIAKHGKPFFEAQLEPIATGDPIASPVVKIFMGDNSFNSFEVRI